MADLDALQFNDEPIEIAHEFEVDLNCLVIVNHKLTLEGIAREEDQQLEQWQAELALNEEMARSMIGAVEQFYEDLRGAANNLAAVGLVTRLQHWISEFVKEISVQPKPPKGDITPMLVRDLYSLNEYLGEGPISVTFFWDLVNVRDSVIHADSKAEWKFRAELRRVAERYTNSWGNVEGN